MGWIHGWVLPRLSCGNWGRGRGRVGIGKVEEEEEQDEEYLDVCEWNR